MQNPLFKVNFDKLALVKRLQFLLILSYLFGMTHELIPHDHDHSQSTHVEQEVFLAECSHGSEPKDFLSHLLDVFTEIDHPSVGEDFSFRAPDTGSIALNVDAPELPMSVALQLEQSEWVTIEPFIIPQEERKPPLDFLLQSSPSRGSPVV